MATSQLHARADELRRQGLTKHRAFRVLRREFPHVEKDQLVMASQISGAPTGYFPQWVQVGGYGLLRPVICKRPPKGK